MSQTTASEQIFVTSTGCLRLLHAEALAVSWFDWFWAVFAPGAFVQVSIPARVQASMQALELPVVSAGSCVRFRFSVVVVAPLCRWVAGLFPPGIAPELMVSLTAHQIIRPQRQLPTRKGEGQAAARVRASALLALRPWAAQWGPRSEYARR